MISLQSIYGPDRSSALSAWQGYSEWPVRQVHIERILACFHDAIERPAALKLRNNARFGSRLEEMLRLQFNLPELDANAPEDIADIFTAISSSDDFMRLVKLSGMIRRANIFAGEIRSNIVQSYNNQFGEEHVRFAVANRNLAIKSALQSIPENLDDLIASEGKTCLSSWISIQSRSVQAWCRMKVAHDPAFPQAVDQERIVKDVEIVRCGAMAILDIEKEAAQ